jgi:hypothetical protein
MGFFESKVDIMVFFQKKTFCLGAFFFVHTCQQFGLAIAGSRPTAKSANSNLRISLAYAMTSSASPAITEAVGDKQPIRSSHDLWSGRHRFRYACRDD